MLRGNEARKEDFLKGFLIHGDDIDISIQRTL